MSSHLKELSMSLRDKDLSKVKKETTICLVPFKTFLVCLCSFLIAIGTIALAIIMLHSALPSFHELIELEHIMIHLEAFQEIADQNHGSRGVFYGFNQSFDYVYKTLEENTHLVLSVQEFPIRVFSEKSPPEIALMIEGEYEEEDPEDFQTFQFSGSGEVISSLSEVKDSGCDENDYSNTVPNTIFLTKRGNCSATIKAELSSKFGASALLIMSEGDAHPGALDSNSNVTFPVIGISKFLGKILGSSLFTQVKVRVDGEIIETFSKNLIAETTHGSEENVIVLGAHLDSVNEAPGINDNGSGSAANLAIALALRDFRERPKNKVIFAWWGGEEGGAVGSQFFLNTIKENNKLSNIVAYLDTEMIGSPNYIMGVLEVQTHNEIAKIGSFNIGQLFEEHFREHDLGFEFVTVSGNYDFPFFLENGIPIGGINSGGEDLKTDEERTLFGGLANVPLDPCYHKSCDSIHNINKKCLLDMTRAMARVFYEMVMEKDLREELSLGPEEVDPLP